MTESNRRGRQRGMGAVNLLVQFRTLLILATCANAKSRPHIIFIMPDDMGWNDVGFHGMTDIPTPNIDAMAAHSVVLNDHYSYALCTPSKASLLTGRYTSNIGMYDQVILNAEPWGLPLGIKLLPEYLNELGYESHIVGKWHLGHHRRQYTPTYRGFQTHYGFWNGGVDFFDQKTRAINYTVYASLDTIPVTDDQVLMVGKDMVDQLKPVKNKRETYLTTLLTRRAKKIIKKHDTEKPLFLFLAHHGVHRGNLARPIRGPENETKIFSHFLDEPKRNFAGCLVSLDTSLGAIFKALEDKKMLEDSVIVFASDNGSPISDPTENGGSNWPLRGQKGTPWEGGVRTVAMVWSHKLQVQSAVRNGLFHVSDWMPTLYKMAGGRVKDLGDIDGLNQFNFIKETKGSARKEVLITINTLRQTDAIRNDRYKLVVWNNGTQASDLRDHDARRSERELEVTWRSSQVNSVLRRFYKTREADVEERQRPTIEVTCIRDQMQPTNVSNENVFLFDLTQDPCEYNNIAQQEPEVVKILLDRISYWKNRSVPEIAKKHLDFKSDPKNFNGHWSTWLDQNQFNSSELYCLSDSEN